MPPTSATTWCKPWNQILYLKDLMIQAQNIKVTENFIGVCLDEQMDGQTGR